jgi:hypothetical protein
MGVTNPLFSFFFLYIIKIDIRVRLHAVFTNSKLNDYINL